MSSNNIVFMTMAGQTILAFLVSNYVVFFTEMKFNYQAASIMLFIFATMIENACEPFCVELLVKMDFGSRAKAESLAIFFKSITTLIFIY